MKRRYKTDLSKTYWYLGEVALDMLAKEAQRHIKCEVEGYVVYTSRPIARRWQMYLSGYASALLTCNADESDRAEGEK